MNHRTTLKDRSKRIGSDDMTSLDHWWRGYQETGDITPLRLGMTRGELRAVFGDPHDVGGVSRKHKIPLIWKYGEFEFHFGFTQADGLRLIYREDEHGNGHRIAGSGI